MNSYTVERIHPFGSYVVAELSNADGSYGGLASSCPFSFFHVTGCDTWKVGQTVTVKLKVATL